MTKKVASLRIKVKFPKFETKTSNKAMLKTAKNAENIAKKSIRDKKSGRKYYSLPNISSVAGEPPANQSGLLVSTIKSKLLATTKTSRGFQIEANTPYAAALEFGRADGHFKMRPYLRPARQKAMKRYITDFTTEDLIRVKSGAIEKRRLY